MAWVIEHRHVCIRCAVIGGSGLLGLLLYARFGWTLSGLIS